VPLLRSLTPIAASPGDPRLLFYTSDNTVGPGIYKNDGYDEDILTYALDYLGQPQQHGTVVDIGGNVGAIAVSLAARHGATRVVAFEPEPKNFKLLTCNVILNDLDERIIVEQTAITDSNTLVTLELAERNFGDHRIRLQNSRGELSEESRSTIQVPGRRLDDALEAAGIDDVALLWLDTQGHEGHILAGAPRLLARRLTWVAEYWPYGLRRANGLDLFHSLVAEHFSRVLDLRQSIVTHRPAVVDATALWDLVGSQLAGGPADYTDLVLLP
jgi:FkbM family methyltransferase